MSLLLYSCNTESLTKCLEKKLDENCTCYMLFWIHSGSNTLQNSSYMATYLPISSIILIRQVRHAGNCWWRKEKFLSDVQLIPTHGHTSVVWPSKTYIHQLCADTGCPLENLSRMMANKDRSQERVKGIHSANTFWSLSPSSQIYQNYKLTILIPGCLLESKVIQ